MKPILIADCLEKFDLIINESLFIVSKDILYITSDFFKSEFKNNLKIHSFQLKLSNCNFPTIRYFLEYLHFQKAIESNETNIDMACLYELQMIFQVNLVIYFAVINKILKNLNSSNILLIIDMAVKNKDEAFLENITEEIRNADYSAVNTALLKIDNQNISMFDNDTIEFLESLCESVKKSSEFYDKDGDYKIKPCDSKNLSIYRKKIKQLFGYEIVPSHFTQNNEIKAFLYVHERADRIISFYDLSDKTSIKSYTEFNYDSGVILNDYFYFVNSKEINNKIDAILYKISIKTISKMKIIEVAPLEKGMTKAYLISVKIGINDFLYAFGNDFQDHKVRNSCQKYLFSDNLWYLLPSYKYIGLPYGCQIDTYLYIFDVSPKLFTSQEVTRLNLLDEEAGWERLLLDGDNNFDSNEFFTELFKPIYIGSGKIMVFGGRTGFTKKFECKFLQIRDSKFFLLPNQTQILDIPFKDWDFFSNELISNGKFLFACNQRHIHSYSLISRKFSLFKNS